MKPKRDKKCSYCGDLFPAFNSLQKFCFKNECIQEHNLTIKKKKANKEKRVFKNSDLTTLKAKAQSLVNKYARFRDEKERGYKCCTCGHTGGQMDGGHFLPTSSYSAIRYNTNQIFLQCKKCNRFNGGMPKEYRLFMIDRYGLEYVEKLEATKNELRGYSIEYYQKLIRVVTKKLKRLTN